MTLIVALRTYVRLDLGRTERAEDQANDAITLDEARDRMKTAKEAYEDALRKELFDF